LQLLERKAQTAGLNWEEYVSAALSRELNTPRTLNDVLAGFRTQVIANGISDRELDRLFSAARHEARVQKS